MKKIILFILGGAFLVLLIAGASAAYSSLSAKYQPGGDFPTIGDKVAVDTTAGAHTHDTDAPGDEETIAAPDFTVYDTDGNAVSLSDFAGKPVVVNFWATWCPPCKSELPDFEEAWKTYGDEVEFLMVNLADDRDTPEKVEAFMTDNGYEFPLYYDSEYDAAYTYGIYSIPVSLFIDADGNLSKGYIGALNASVIESCIKEILP